MNESENKGVPAATPAAPALPAVPAAGAPIEIDQFKLIELKAGRVVSAVPHPNADKLLVLQVDIGEATPRQIVAGIRPDWAPEAITGRNVVIVANLKPAKLRGVESCGMMLAVRGSEKVIPIGIDGAFIPGTRVT